MNYFHSFFQWIHRSVKRKKLWLVSLQIKIYSGLIFLFKKNVFKSEKPHFFLSDRWIFQQLFTSPSLSSFSSLLSPPLSSRPSICLTPIPFSPSYLMPLCLKISISQETCAKLARFYKSSKIDFNPLTVDSKEVRWIGWNGQSIFSTL